MVTAKTNTRNRKKTSTIVEQSKLTCLRCLKNLVVNTKNFYENNNDLFTAEKFPICKSCISEFIGSINENGYEVRVKQILAIMNRPFFEDRWIQAERKWGEYIKNISSMSYLKDSKFAESDFIYKHKGEFIEIGVNDEVEVKTYDKFWKGKYTPSEIEYLNNYFYNLCEAHNIKDADVADRDSAINAAKSSLTMSRFMEEMQEGNTEAFKKYTEAQKVHDAIMTSGKFNAKTRTQNDTGLGGFGVAFNLLEAGRYVYEHIPLAKDDIDTLKESFSSINKSVN